MIILSACSGEKKHYDLSFKGQGEYWEAEYFFSGTEIWKEIDGKTTYSNKNRDELVLTYKGDLKELSSIKFLEYSYETSAGGGGGTREFTEPPTETTFRSTGGSENGAKVSENEVIQIKVKWDNQEESFELHGVSK